MVNYGRTVSVITDPYMAAVAKRVLDSLKIAAEKSVASNIDPVKYPLPAIANSSELIFSKRYNALKPARQKEAVQRIKGLLKTPSNERTRMYGDLINLKLESRESVEEQVERMGPVGNQKMPLDHFKDLALLYTARRPKTIVSIVAPPMIGRPPRVSVNPPLGPVDSGFGVPLLRDYVNEKYIQLGGYTGILGRPVDPPDPPFPAPAPLPGQLSPQKYSPDGMGRFRIYENGSIYWSSLSGAHEVHGAIRLKWGTLNWERGFLGYPLTDETAAVDGTGRFNNFQGGSIYWNPLTGAFEIHGAIRGRWQALGGEGSFLGYPITDETTTPDGIGRFNEFQGGSVYWSPDTGAFEIHGPIRARWKALGAESGPLGYPVSDETVGEFNHYQYFQGGTITWDAATGAKERIINNLELVLYQVKCFVETQNVFFGDWGEDEITLGATTTDSEGTTVKVPVFKVGDFDTGTLKTYTPPLILASFGVQKGGFPKNYFVTFVMAEEDFGGIADFLNDLYQKTKSEVVKEIAKLLVDYGIKVIGGNIIAALDALASLIGLPSVAGLVTEIVGGVLAAIAEWIVSWFADEIFNVITVRIDISSVHDPLIISPTGGQVSTLDFYGDGAHYGLDYGWRFGG